MTRRTDQNARQRGDLHLVATVATSSTTNTLRPLWQHAECSPDRHRRANTGGETYDHAGNCELSRSVRRQSDCAPATVEGPTSSNRVTEHPGGGRRVEKNRSDLPLYRTMSRPLGKTQAVLNLFRPSPEGPPMVRITMIHEGEVSTDENAEAEVENPEVLGVSLRKDYGGG